jgi:hypothetical protein
MVWLSNVRLPALGRFVADESRKYRNRDGSQLLVEEMSDGFEITGTVQYRYIPVHDGTGRNTTTIST